jgi:myo-inositol-1(or 4)-monophosphatase
VTPDLPINPVDVRDVLEGAAAIVRTHFGRLEDVRIKPDGTPVTKADLEVESFLRTALLNLLPSAQFLSEERARDGRVGRSWVWVVDPLDGTKEFLQHIPECAISVGLVHDSRSVFGAVVNPIRGEGGMGWGERPAILWGMSRRNGAAARCLSEASVSVSRTEIVDGSAAPYVDCFRRCSPIGSVAYKLLRVAAGVEDLTFSVQPKSEWDVCGGLALLRSSGREYKRFDGQEWRFNQPSTRILSGTVAGPAHLVQEFLTFAGVAS